MDKVDGNYIKAILLILILYGGGIFVAKYVLNIAYDYTLLVIGVSVVILVIALKWYLTRGRKK